jgi:hypothetical protein
MKLKDLRLKPRHKWFSSDSKDAENGWYGPHKTVEEAIIDCASNWFGGEQIFIAQGYKLTKLQREEYGDPEYDWEVDSRNAFKVILPTTPKEEIK